MTSAAECDGAHGPPVAVCSRSEGRDWPLDEPGRQQEIMSDGTQFMTAWRIWVRDHLAASAILAGLVATQVATVVGYWMTGIGLPQLDWNRVNGAIFTPGASPTVQFYSGGIFHYIDGIVFALVFVAGVYPWLPGPA